MPCTGGALLLGRRILGGLVTFEMAQQLHAQGQKVALLALFDTYGPGARFDAGVTARQRQISYLRHRVKLQMTNLKMLEPQDRLSYLAQRFGKVPKMIRQTIKNKYRKLAPKVYQAIGRPLPPALQKTHDAISRAHLDYWPRIKPYPGRLTIFRAKTQLPGIAPDPRLGWDGYAAEGLDIHEVPGFHGAIIVEPHVRFLTEELKQCFAQARATDAHDPA